MKKVLLDIRPLQTTYLHKGIGRYTLELTKAISKIYPIQLLVFGRETLPEFKIPIGISAPKWRRQWVWDLFILPFLIKWKGFQIFHNLVALGPLDSIAFPAFFTNRCIVTVHDLHMFHKDAGPLDVFYRSTQRIRIQKRKLHLAKAIVTDVSSVQLEVKQLFSGSADKVYTIPLGGDHTLDWPELTQDEFDKFNIPQNFIFSIGDTPNKNLNWGYQILKKLKLQFPELAWVICGNARQVKIQLAKNELPKWIHIVSEISDAMLKKLYRNAQFTLIPSIKEGFGIPVLEATWCEGAVVASNIEAFKDHLPKGHSLDPLDTSDHSLKIWSELCSKLISDLEYRSQSITKHRQFTREATWVDAATQIVQLYDSEN